MPFSKRCHLYFPAILSKYSISPHYVVSWSLIRLKDGRTYLSQFIYGIYTCNKHINWAPSSARSFLRLSHVSRLLLSQDCDISLDCDMSLDCLTVT
jgi:hypothetical protein